MTQQTTTIAMDVSMDLLVAVDFKDKLMSVLENGADIRIDGSSVERISTAVVQIMIAAYREAIKSGGSFRLEKPSAALVSAITDLGLKNYLEKWECV